MRCWSCDSTTPECTSDCECAKCADPIDYANWKYENPQEYQEWLDDAKMEED